MAARRRLSVFDLFPSAGHDFGGMELARTTDEQDILEWILDVIQRTPLARKAENSRLMCTSSLTMANQVRAGLHRVRTLLRRRRATSQVAVIDRVLDELSEFLDTHLPGVRYGHSDPEVVLRSRRRAMHLGRSPIRPAECAAQANRLFDDLEAELLKFAKRRTR